MECGICDEEFNLTEREPCVLPCGHTFCTLCVNRSQILITLGASGSRYVSFYSTEGTRVAIDFSEACFQLFHLQPETGCYALRKALIVFA